MRLFPLAVAALALALSGCVAPVGPVEVTRFHVPDSARIGRGAVAVEPAPGMVADSLEWRTYAAAVGRQLTLAGYREQAAGTGDQVAYVRLQRQTYQPQRNRSPVSVGVGGSTGSYGSGVGLGLGIDLSGPPPAVVETELAVTIKDRATGQALWEGRSSFAVSEKSPLANSQLGAAKMAEALFKGFPGNSGETIQVK
jgi:hypothetical protein